MEATSAMATPTLVNIPTLTLSDFSHGTPEARKHFINALGEALKDTGFVKIDGHGVDQALIRKTYALFQEFYGLPTEVKAKYDIVAGGQRGYTGFGKEHAKDSKVGDLKEFFHVGRQFDASSPLSGVYAANVWPSELPELRNTALELYDALENAARQLLEAIGAYFGRPEGEFSRIIEGGDTIMRAIHYPPLNEGMDPRAVRAAAHEDINLITILCEATTSGLELLTRDGEWVAIDALEGQFVVDAGDMLQRLTNGVIPSTTHRVVNPAGGANASRYSLPFFVHPHGDYVIECLACCDTPDNPRRWEPVTAREFLNQRLREIGLLM